MKRFLPLLLILLFLFGCGGAQKPIDKAMSLRSKILQSNGCSFNATITADYFDKVQVFRLQCSCDTAGNISFSVLEPASISGITGKIEGQGGKLTFDDHVLLFSLMAGNDISPVSAPWLMLNGLRSGYIRGCADSDDGLSIHIDDTLGQNTLQIVLQTNSNGILSATEIFYQQRRILAIKIDDFTFL